MVRDTYTATGLASISSTMLHTTALGAGAPRPAELSLTHLKDLTSIIGDLSEAACRVVADELADEGEIANWTVAETAVRNTQQAWRREVMDDTSH